MQVPARVWKQSHCGRCLAHFLFMCSHLKARKQQEVKGKRRWEQKQQHRGCNLVRSAHSNLGAGSGRRRPIPDQRGQRGGGWCDAWAARGAGGRGATATCEGDAEACRGEGSKGTLACRRQCASRGAGRRCRWTGRVQLAEEAALWRRCF